LIQQAPPLAAVFNRKESAPSHMEQMRFGTLVLNPNQRGEPRHPPLSTACQNLHGEHYAAYIRLTHTRSLGGVSLTQRSRIIRQLFPYKPFPRRKAESSSEEQEARSDGEIEIISVDDSQIKQEVPKDGNKEVKSAFWTAAELKQHDEKIRGWARWEVDKSAHVVRSTKCTRLTTNPDKICDECQEVSRDESFKSDVRKVWIHWQVCRGQDRNHF
jgi:hypothetical protein